MLDEMLCHTYKQLLLLSNFALQQHEFVSASPGI
jgi:hypothetical protein